MKVMVTGGAGYVGSVVAEELIKDGYDVLVIDNLKQGHLEAVPKEAIFIQSDIGDARALERIFQQHKIDAVMHMAADSIVELSMLNPAQCFQNNVSNSLNLVTTMIKNDVRRIVFSSSAAIYGKPRINVIRETQSKKPVNAYGESKLIFERILTWYEKAYELKHISLRYFNAAGASELRGEDHRPESHLIPNILNVALTKDATVKIFGDDYPTKDGTCVRDYVHVIDIARAHILALNKLGNIKCKAFNLGNGAGYSVVEIIEAAKKVTGVNITTSISSRRFGDPATLVASSKLASEELGWKPRFSNIEQIVKTAWKWMQLHPHGYES